MQNIPEYFTCGCKIFRNILPAGAKYSGLFYIRGAKYSGILYLRVQNILHVGAKYFTCGCKIFWKFSQRVQNIPEYFTFGCKIFRNTLPAGAKYSGIFYPRVQIILPVGVKYSGIFYPRVQNIPEYFTFGGAKYSGIFYLRVQNIPEYFTCGYKIFRNILPAGAKYSGIFYLWVQNILPAGAKYKVHESIDYSQPGFYAGVNREDFGWMLL